MKRVTIAFLVALSLLFLILIFVWVCRIPFQPRAGKALFTPIRIIETISLAPGYLGALAVSQDGSTLAYGRSVWVPTNGDIHGRPISRATLHVHDLHKHKEVTCLEQAAWVSDLAFSPNGSRLASVGQEPSIHIWNTASWGAKISLQGPSTHLSTVAYSPDGMFLAAGSAIPIATVALLNLKTGSPGPTFTDHELSVSAIAFSRDSQYLLTAGKRGPIHLWEMPKGKSQLRIPVPLPGFENGMVGVRAVAFAPDSRTFATITADQLVRIWDVDSKVEKWRFPRQPWPFPSKLAYSPDGNVLVIGCRGSIQDRIEVQFWDVQARERLAAISTLEGELCAICFVPGHPRLVVGFTGASDQSIIEVWDVSRILEQAH